MPLWKRKMWSGNSHAFIPFNTQTIGPFLTFSSLFRFRSLFDFECLELRPSSTASKSLSTNRRVESSRKGLRWSGEEGKHIRQLPISKTGITGWKSYSWISGTAYHHLEHQVLYPTFGGNWAWLMQIYHISLALSALISSVFVIAFESLEDAFDNATFSQEIQASVDTLADPSQWRERQLR